ncbi:MAG: DNA phosphorothioation system sulfurtransferase DndC [Clostridiales bacterium]|nr:DNA phosphorothioation system sulfurtransferase DndC [Clostridiales bacterium]
MANTITKKTINGLMETIRNLYLADDIPWVIGYSGGKDSTATLELVWLSLQGLPVEQRNKTVHIINTDTLVESPVVSKWVEKSLDHMKEEAQKSGMPFVTHRITPETNNTFWVNLIGRGYPFPRMKYRWCTDRLKIQPVNKFIKDKIAEHGEIILVLGTRKAESSRRARTMAYYEKKRVRELLSPNPTMANELVFSPLEDWTDDDVWIFLMQYKNPWGYSNMDLLTLYRGATADNECPFQTEKNLPSCGKSRFGCWVCTMVEKDKSMEAMIANDYEKTWMTPLLEFRNEFGAEEGDRERRSFRRMNGTLRGSYGQLYHGPYKKEYREKWLRRLLEIQVDIQNNGPEDFRNLELITVPEMREIRRIWVKDKHEFDDSLPGIYQEVMGIEFSDPEWIGNESFGKEEWNILMETCKDLFKEEELMPELMSSIMDVELRAKVMAERKGVLEKIDTCVRKTFYKNETDAKEFYLKRVNRQKDVGGKYDEKFLEEYVREHEDSYGTVFDSEDVDA